MPKPWKPDKIYRELADWVSDPENVDFHYYSEIAILDKFDWPSADSAILGSFRGLARWFRSKSCASIHAGAIDDGLTYAGEASVCSLMDCTVYTNGFVSSGTSSPDIQRFGQWIAHALTFGHLEVAKRLVVLLARCAEFEKYDASIGRAPAFCARLAARALGMSNPVE